MAAEGKEVTHRSFMSLFGLNLPKFHDLYILDKKLRSGSYGSVYKCKHRLHDHHLVNNTNPNSGMIQTVRSSFDKLSDAVNMMDISYNTKPQSTAPIDEEGESSGFYAVKIIDRSKLKSKDEDAMFREVEVLRQLTSKSVAPDKIMQFVDFFEDEKTFFLVTEFCLGGDLFDRIAKRVFYTEVDARDVGQNILEAMKAIHSLRIAHRDIKPENILLVSSNNDAQIKIADFGFATQVKRDFGLKTRCGTPAFVAPELLLKSGYDERADMWSVGVTLYILIGGYMPFAAEDEKQMFIKIRSGDFAFHHKYWKNVSVDAKHLISSLLTTNPAKRMSANDALKSKWVKTEFRKELSTHDLSASLDGLRKFNAKNKLRGAVHGVRWAMSAQFWQAQRIAGFVSKNITSKRQNLSDIGVSKVIPPKSFRTDFSLLEKVNSGAFASVWKGVRKDTNEVFAVKIVRRVDLKPKDDAAVLNEVAILQSLDHKSIIRVEDFYEESDYFFICMQLMTGGDVFDKIVQKTQYTEKDARDLARSLIQAVEHMHSRRVCHRDLKPQNLLLRSEVNDSDIQVGDFGFAKRVHTPKSLVTRCGTPTYVGPEILKNIPYDESVDMWSIGVIIYVLLVGYPPFMENNQKDLFNKIKKGEFEFYDEDWGSISDDAKQLISNLMVVDPAKRWTAERALRCSWIDEVDDDLLSMSDISGSIRELQDFKSRSAGDAEDIWHTSPKKSLKVIMTDDSITADDENGTPRSLSL